AAPAAPAGRDDEADPMVELFVGKCASCHTIGDGDRVGPDLQGVHTERDRDWLHSMIQTPSQMLASDAQARQLLARYNGVKMPDLGLDDAQVQGLIDLIARCSDEPCDLAGRFVPVADATEEDVLRGERLFLGHERLENGAGACISCHTVRGASTSVPGGTLAMDLTNTYARLGDEGLDAALKNPAFLLMNRIFADRPLTQEEAFALRAFLHDANLSEPTETASLSLPLFGLLGAGVVLLILNAFWGRRLRGVRKPLTQGGRPIQSRDLLAAGEGGSASGTAAERGEE
ncbi:MAG: c-type cytochrome, partial [Acidobacteriota bacterium]